MDNTFKGLNEKRTKAYHKDQEEEEYLLNLNKNLAEIEQASYQDIEIQHPLIFVLGLPRSGTTFTSQLLAYGFNAGFINNFAARFWLSPVTGIKLANVLLKDKENSGFKSNYATTEELSDIHEFGYFWRHWLKLEKMSDFKTTELLPDNIDWNGLKRTLANMQAQFNKPMVMKNLFGACYFQEMMQALKKVIYVYVERDPVDNAISILDARKKFYDDPNTWWSTLPPNYEQLLELNYWEQIAGQVYSLKKYYDESINNSTFKNQVIRVNYCDLAKHPDKLLDEVNQKAENLWGSAIGEYTLPQSFEPKTYMDRTEDRMKFEKLLKEASNKY